MQLGEAGPRCNCAGERDCEGLERGDEGPGRRFEGNRREEEEGKQRRKTKGLGSDTHL